MRRLNLLILVFITCTFSLLQAQNYKYPTTRKVKVTDDYHGIKVSDPYRWMEDENDPDLKIWIDEENKLTQKYLDIPEREKIKSRLTQVWNYPKYSVPFHRKNRYFFLKNDGLQNQSVLFLQETISGEPKVILDPNKLSTDGTIALTDYAITEDGMIMAYALSTSGSDWQEIKIRNLNTMQDYKDTIRWCKFADIAWKQDNSGFYYNRFPDPDTIPRDQQSYNNKVYWHKLGTRQSEDVLIYERQDAKELGFSPFITEDGKYLCLHVWKGTDPTNRFYYREVSGGNEFIRLLDENDAKYDFIDNDGPIFYFQTDLSAPKGRIIAIDIHHPERNNWKEIIPQRKEPIDFIATVNSQFIVTYLQDAHHSLQVFNMDGNFLRKIELPTLGSISGLSGKRKDKEMFFGFTSYLYPTTIFRYDFNKDSLVVFRKPEIQFDADQYKTEQIFYTSKDGTKIPMFITCKKGLKLDGKNPVWLYGYGGFNISLTPVFSPAKILWLELGGVYAVANLRGGSEYGEEWHRAGMLEKKQNVFDDFICAAQWLIDKKYTRASKLVINGASNGGLLIAACMVQRPELFGAVVCQVPVIDMLRYHKFTVGRYWTGEYGNADADSEQFKFMYAYSPLHNIRKGVEYPPTLITTADHDDRVVPAHAMKFAATLQEMYNGKNPILVRIETKAGHGGGKPTAKIIDEQSDVYAFLMKTFGIIFK